MKLSRKVIACGSGALALSIIGASVLAAYALSQSANNNLPINNPIPTGRQNYKHEVISSLIDKKDVKNKCVEYEDNKVLGIGEAKFRNNIETIVRDTLRKVNKFKNNADSYRIEVSYQYLNPKTMALDLVWSMPGVNQQKYYDQMQINLVV